MRSSFHSNRGDWKDVDGVSNEKQSCPLQPSISLKVSPVGITFCWSVEQIWVWKFITDTTKPRNEPIVQLCITVGLNLLFLHLKYWRVIWLTVNPSGRIETDKIRAQDWCNMCIYIQVCVHVPFWAFSPFHINELIIFTDITLDANGMLLLLTGFQVAKKMIGK